MAKFLFSSLVILSTSIASAQGNINKGDWMVGGQAGFSSTKISGLDGSSTNIELSPNAGYFFANQLAGGLEVSLQSIKEEDDDAVTAFAVAPFLRYYFLPATQKVNVFLQGSYGIGSASQSSESVNLNQFSFVAGPSIFLSPVAALEFGIGYTSAGGEAFQNPFTGESYRQTTFGLRVGFQIHLPGSGARK